jgi:hypothetical protein
MYYAYSGILNRPFSLSESVLVFYFLCLDEKEWNIVFYFFNPLRMYEERETSS